MTFFNRLMELAINTAKIVFLCERKGILDVFIHIALILFECQSIVGLLFDDLGGNGPLCAHGVNRHQTAFQVQEVS
jgi:hypothetical protein